MNSFMVAIILERIPIGTEFRKWPHHVTLIPWFEYQNVEELKSRIHAICSQTKPFEILVQGPAYFGAKKKMRSSTIQKCDAILTLHYDLLKLAENQKLKHVADNFTPHISHKHEPYPKDGDVFHVSEIHLVKDLQKNMERELIGTYQLNAKL